MRAPTGGAKATWRALRRRDVSAEPRRAAARPPPAGAAAATACLAARSAPRTTPSAHARAHATRPRTPSRACAAFALRRRADAPDAPKAEGLSKNEQKRLAKQAEKEKKAAEKAAAKAAEAANAPAKAKKDAGPVLEEEDEDMDPSKYFENRLAWVNGKKAAGINPYPHKFHATLQLPDYHDKCARRPSRLNPANDTLDLTSKYPKP